jgi:hypothetical protein
MTEKKEIQSVTELKLLTESGLGIPKFECEVCHKHEAVLLCGFCGKRVCLSCMKPREGKARLCCGQEPKEGSWKDA